MIKYKTSNNKSQTKLDSFEIVKRKNIDNRQSMIILRFLKTFDKGFTRNEISEILMMRLSSVCARVKPMIDKGLIYSAGRKENHKFSEMPNELLKAKT